MRSFIRHLPLFLIIVSLPSCSLQKRNYLPGYYISWKKHSSETKLPETAEQSRSQEQAINRIETHLITAPQPPEPRVGMVNIRQPKIPNADPCDTLILQNGTEIKVKVLEINRDEVKYKYCNNPDGPTIIVSKADVKLIRYANGTGDEFPEAKAVLPDDHVLYTNDLIRRQAGGSLASGILSFFIIYFGVITAAIAIIKGRRALRLMDSESAFNLKYYKQARAGLILGIIFYSLLAILLLLGFIGMII